MKNKDTILKVAILVLICVMLGILGIKNIKDKDEDKKSDALKFKEEYESLNDTIRESDGHLYNNVDIPEDNIIKYIDAKEAVDIIKNGEGVIYFGANWCPWCRNAIGVLFDAADTKLLDKIYYVDMDTIKNSWAVNDGQLIKTQNEKEGYYDLLDALDSVLGDSTYKLKDNDIEYDTNEKRIYMPFVISVKNGNILKTHTGTVKLNEDQDKYSYLTSEQKKELKNIYIKLIEAIELVDSCDKDSSCD